MRETIRAELNWTPLRTMAAKSGRIVQQLFDVPPGLPGAAGDLVDRPTASFRDDLVFGIDMTAQLIQSI